MYKCLNTKGSIKEQLFLSIRGTGKRKKVPVSKILESSGSLPLPHGLSFIVETRDNNMQGQLSNSSIIQAGALCQYELTSWHYIVIKRSIIDDLEVQDLPLVCFFTVQKITKKIAI